MRGNRNWRYKGLFIVRLINPCTYLPPNVCMRLRGYKCPLGRCLVVYSHVLRVRLSLTLNQMRKKETILRLEIMSQTLPTHEDYKLFRGYCALWGPASRNSPYEHSTLTQKISSHVQKKDGGTVSVSSVVASQSNSFRCVLQMAAPLSIPRHSTPRVRTTST